MDNNNSQGSSEGEELKKLEEELKGFGNTSQEVRPQSPAVEQTAPSTLPVAPTLPPSPEPAIPAPQVPQATQPLEPSKSPNKILMMAIGFLVLALAGAGGYLF